MEIICDTNIWYNFALDNIDTAKIRPNDKLITTFNSIDEFTTTDNLIYCTEQTRNAIQIMFRYSARHAIFEPPLIYLKKLADPTYQYAIETYQKQILQFTELIANGHSIDEIRKEEFLKLVNERKDKLKKVADFFNDEAKIIKPKIKDLNKHRQENSIPINRKLINLFVANQTKTDGLPDKFDWTQVTLFEKTLKVFFNEIETGAMKFMPNDWFDLFLLVYVNPSRKIWTREKKWKILIQKAGMSDYLYEE